MLWSSIPWGPLLTRLKSPTGVELLRLPPPTLIWEYSTDPRFSMRAAAPPRVYRGYAAISSLERQCVHLHFQDISSKLHLFHALVTPTVLHGIEVWGPNLSSYWVSVERVLVSTLSHSIQSKRTVPHHIMLAKFGYQPLQVWSLVALALFLCRLHNFASPKGDVDQLPYRALASSIVHQGQWGITTLRVFQW